MRKFKTLQLTDLDNLSIDELSDLTPVVLEVKDEDNNSKEKLIKFSDLTCGLTAYPDYIKVKVGSKYFSCAVNTVELFDYSTATNYIEKILDFREDVDRYFRTTDDIIIITYMDSFVEEVNEIFDLILKNCTVTVSCVENCPE